MADYLVRMADERGNVLEQTYSGSSAGEVKERFAQQGYYVFSVRPSGLLTAGFKVPKRRKIKLNEFIIFNQQFVTLIKAGLPIVQALDLLAKRQRNVYFQGVLQDVRDRVRGGSLLSEAFDAQGTLPKIYSTTVLAGEKSGNLEEVLSRYVAFQRLALTFRKKLLSSLIYPALLVIGVAVLMTVLITFVIPRFAGLFKDMEAPMPAITQVTISVAMSLKSSLPIVLLVGAVVGFFLWRWSKTPSGGQAMDHVKLGMPLLGTIWLRYQVALFSRTMATLLLGGIPLVPALETAEQSMASRLVRRSITVAAKGVREGRPLSRGLEETKLFPELSIEMIEVGESTGALPQMLTSVAEFFEEDVQTALTASMSLIEPVILIVMGVVVGYILISLYMPIFSIGAAAH